MGLYEMDVSVDESFSPDSCTRNDGLSCRNRRQPGKASDIICVYSQLNDGLSVSLSLHDNARKPAGNFIMNFVAECEFLMPNPKLGLSLSLFRR